MSGLFSLLFLLKCEYCSNHYNQHTRLLTDYIQTLIISTVIYIYIYILS